MGEDEPSVNPLLGQVPMVKRKEVAHVIRDERAAQLCRTLQYDSIVEPDQILMLCLNRFDVPSAASQLDADLGVEHLIEQEL